MQDFFLTVHKASLMKLIICDQVGLYSSVGCLPLDQFCFGVVVSALAIMIPTPMLSSSRQQIKQKNSSSKYDFVKVRVHLSNEHYYVLSRFLLARMLTATRLDYGHALRIALDLKKRLVDKAELYVSQEQLEHELFVILQQRGYGQEHIEWYKTMARYARHRKGRRQVGVCVSWYSLLAFIISVFLLYC